MVVSTPAFFFSSFLLPSSAVSLPPVSKVEKLPIAGVELPALAKLSAAAFDVEPGINEKLNGCENENAGFAGVADGGATAGAAGSGSLFSVPETGGFDNADSTSARNLLYWLSSAATLSFKLTTGSSAIISSIDFIKDLLRPLSFVKFVCSSSLLWLMFAVDVGAVNKGEVAKVEASVPLELALMDPKFAWNAGCTVTSCPLFKSSPALFVPLPKVLNVGLLCGKLDDDCMISVALSSFPPNGVPPPNVLPAFSENENAGMPASGAVEVILDLNVNGEIADPAPAALQSVVVPCLNENPGVDPKAGPPGLSEKENAGVVATGTLSSPVGAGYETVAVAGSGELFATVRFVCPKCPSDSCGEESPEGCPNEKFSGFCDVAADPNGGGVEEPAEVPCRNRGLAVVAELLAGVAGLPKLKPANA
ncbi:hypothetical protein BJ742DRAFT_47332 [Cladochytrium replicatum]|nr:hypothetical protein BJ742DRAFT_47332 [Cladochytrium replicatum]